MHHATIAVTLAAALTSGCTVVIQNATSTGDDESTSAASSSSEAGESSSTGEPDDHVSSTGEVEADETSTGDETTGEIVESDAEGSTSSGETSCTSTGDEGTTTSGGGGDETSGADDTGGSTTDVVPASVPMGGVCTLDSDCESNFCAGGGFNDQPRCSTFCWPGTATDCFVELGHPGLCTWGGGDAYVCTGVFDFEAPDLRLATPDPDVDFVYYQNSGFLPTTADRHAYLVPPQQVAYYVEMGSINDPGYGPVVVDVHASDGTLIGTFEQGDNPTIEPKGIHHYHWLIVRPADDKKASYQLYLKELCWPNC